MAELAPEGIWGNAIDLYRSFEQHYSLFFDSIEDCQRFFQLLCRGNGNQGEFELLVSAEEIFRTQPVDEGVAAALLDAIDSYFSYGAYDFAQAGDVTVVLSPVSLLAGLRNRLYVQLNATEPD